MDPLNFQNNAYSDQSFLPASAEVKFINVEYYFNKIYVFLHNMFGGGGSVNNPGEVAGVSSTHAVSYYFNIFAGFLTDILYLLLILFFTVIAYVAVRMLEIRKKEHEHLHHEIHEFAHKQKEHAEKKAQGGGSVHPKNERWEQVLKNVYGETQAEWKLAIIDADEMLHSLMIDMGFKGEGLGEKLKNADRDEFHSLSAAWEVHTIRNRIAHEGSTYELTQREAKRVIALYENIFHEFGYI